MKTQSLIDDPTRASRYLADQLTDAECAEYEARFVEDPDAVAELEATARLKIGLQRLRSNGELSELIAGTAAPQPNRTWMLAMAAGIAAVVIGVSLWFPRTGPIVGSPSSPPRPAHSKTATVTRCRSWRPRRCFVHGPRSMTLSSSCRPRAAPSSCGCCLRLPRNRLATRLH